MTQEEYKQLELLLGKLNKEVKEKRLMIINGYISDGYHLATYDNEGCLKNQITGPSIQWCVNKLFIK